MTQTSHWFNIPNLLTLIRIVMSPLMILLAAFDSVPWLLVLGGVLVITEWLDGPLARHWNLTSPLGARLDTVADAVFYCSVLITVAILLPHTIWQETAWIAAAILSYAASWLTSWRKFGRLPSYHTWAAKGVWVIVIIGIGSLVTGGVRWPFRTAMACVVLTNLEATWITSTLATCHVDVPTIWHARRLTQRDR